MRKRLQKLRWVVLLPLLQLLSFVVRTAVLQTSLSRVNSMYRSWWVGERGRFKGGGVITKVSEHRCSHHPCTRWLLLHAIPYRDHSHPQQMAVWKGCTRLERVEETASRSVPEDLDGPAASFAAASGLDMVEEGALSCCDVLLPFPEVVAGSCGFDVEGSCT